MIIADWEILIGIFLIVCTHILTVHVKAILGSIFLVLIACWLIKQGISKWNKFNVD